MHFPPLLSVISLYVGKVNSINYMKDELEAVNYVLTPCSFNLDEMIETQS